MRSPDSRDPFFGKIVEQVLASGRIDIAVAESRRAPPDQELADQIVLWSTAEGLAIIDRQTFMRYSELQAMARAEG